MKLLMLLTVCVAAISVPAQAEENPFAYSYTADVEGPGETELALWLTDRRAKAEGHYDAQDYKLEVEHGFSDRLSVAGYAKFASHHIHGLEPQLESVSRDFAFQGLSAEFRYKLLDSGRNGIGLALYAEPGWSRIHDVEGIHGTEYELELKAIADKELLNERLIWAANLTFEPEWERETRNLAGDRNWEKELKIEATAGLAWRLAPHWHAGVEGRYASVYPDWTHRLHRSDYALSAGPTISFAADEWSATLSWMPQVSGSPTLPRTGGLDLDEFEKNEVRLRIAHEF